MRINTKIRYGLRTMIELACNDEPGGILQKDIAEKQNLSNKYLDSIVSSLKAKGLITNAKGKGSGYKLTKPACEITMYEIYTAFEPVTVVECTENSRYCELFSCCSATHFWTELKTELIDILKSKTLKDIARKEKPCNKFSEQV